MAASELNVQPHVAHADTGRDETAAVAADSAKHMPRARENEFTVVSQDLEMTRQRSRRRPLAGRGLRQRQLRLGETGRPARRLAAARAKMSVNLRSPVDRDGNACRHDT